MTITATATTTREITTVEDRAGLDALPIGARIRPLDGSGVDLIKEADELYRWDTPLRGITRTPQELSTLFGYLPAELRNPAILGDFTDPLTITVEDQAGLDALPVGTKLLDKDGDTLTMRADRAVDWTDSFGHTHAGPLSDPQSYLPATVLNPEILGDFKVSTGGFKVGDRVRIVGTDLRDVYFYDVEDEDIFTTVIETRDKKYPVGVMVGSDPAYTAWADPEEIELVVEAHPFEVGDRLRVLNEGVFYDRGTEVKVTRTFFNNRAEGRNRARVAVVDDEGRAVSDLYAWRFEKIEVAPIYAKGDRVQVVEWSEGWDGPATVTEDYFSGGRYVLVETDKDGRVGGFYPDNIEPLVEAEVIDPTADFKLAGDESGFTAEMFVRVERSVATGALFLGVEGGHGSAPIHLSEEATLRLRDYLNARYPA